MPHYMGTPTFKKIAKPRFVQGFSYFDVSKFRLGNRHPRARGDPGNY